MGREGSPAAPLVNNFAAANGAATGTEWPEGFISCIRMMISRTGGSGLLTTSRSNDFELYGPPAGAV